MIMGTAQQYRGLVRGGDHALSSATGAAVHVGRLGLFTPADVKREGSTYSIPDLNSKLLVLLCLGLATCPSGCCAPCAVVLVQRSSSGLVQMMFNFADSHGTSPCNKAEISSWVS